MYHTGREVVEVRCKNSLQILGMETNGTDINAGFLCDLVTALEGRLFHITCVLNHPINQYKYQFLIFKLAILTNLNFALHLGKVSFKETIH